MDSKATTATARSMTDIHEQLTFPNKTKRIKGSPPAEWVRCGAKRGRWQCGRWQHPQGTKHVNYYPGTAISRVEWDD